MSFNARVIAGAAAALLAAFALLFLLRSGEEGRIKAVLEDGVALAIKGDAEACVSLLAKDYSHGGLTRDMVADQIRSQVKPGRWTSIQLLSIDPAAEGKAGQAKIRLLLEQGGARLPLAMMLFFRKEGEAWRISGYDILER